MKNLSRTEQTTKNAIRKIRRRRVNAKQNKILFSAAECKYDCIIEAVQEVGWRIIGEKGQDRENSLDISDNDTCNVYWIDVANIADRMSKLRPWQRINHFPGMSNIARKNRLAQNLEKMRREFPKDYSFYPRTWVLPLELADFRAQFDSTGRSSRFYIVKPDSGCQGRGIFLTQSFDAISPLEQVVAQRYIRKPLLIDGFKFDLRLYVLVTSCKPLRIYLFHDGLVRLCTQEYLKPNAENVNMRCMHLTNYAINKHNENFQGNEHLDASNVGSKRSLRWFMDHIAIKKGQSKADALWRRMGAMSVKVILSILPTLVREYEAIFFKGLGKSVSEQSSIGELEGSRCFELLGVDIIIDHALKPWLVEVNHLPSFATDSPLDLDIKSRVIEQTISIIRVKASDRSAYEQTERFKAEERLYNQPNAMNSAKIPGNGIILRRHIEDILRRHAPEKLVKIDALFQKYAGREAKLSRLVEQKYLTLSSGDSESQPQPQGAALNISKQYEGSYCERKAVSTNGDVGYCTDTDVEFEDELLADFDRLFPVPHSVRQNYDAPIAFVFAQDEKRIKRMSCPLRQNRGSALNFAETLPPLSDGKKDVKERKSPWGDPFRGGASSFYKSTELNGQKHLPMPGLRQLAAANRLTRGFSSRQPNSAPSSLGATTDYADNLTGVEDCAQKVANTVSYAKECRRRMDDARKRRSHGQVALQPRTFIFAQGPEQGPSYV